MAAGFSLLAEPDASGQEALTDARTAFYNADFEQAAALTLDLCAADDVDACELRTSALLMEIKRAIGDEKDKDKAFKACEKCQGLAGRVSARYGPRPGGGPRQAQSQPLG